MDCRNVSSAEIQALNGTRGITVFSNVPDVRPYISGASVYVVPLRIGSGVKVKIMEALAMGKAIVATLSPLKGWVWWMTAI